MKTQSILLIVSILFSFNSVFASDSESFTVLKSTKFKAKHRQHYKTINVNSEQLGSDFTLLIQNGRKLRLKDCSKKRKAWRQRWCEKWNDWRRRWQKYTRVDQGQILINGSEVVGIDQLNSDTDTLEIDIDLEADNQLEVNLRGKRHSFIRMKIIGTESSNQAPVANLISTSGDTEFLVDATAEFDASGSTDDGTIVEYRWDFGDGNSATTATATVQHSYSAAGDYTVSLVVVDDQGAESAVAELDVTARLPAPLVADFQTTPSVLVGSFPFTVEAANSSSSDDTAITSVEWETSIGDAGSGDTFITVFPFPGTFTLTLTVIDEIGRVETKTVDVIVNF